MSVYTVENNKHLLDDYAERLRDRITSIQDDVYRNIASNAEQRLEIVHMLRESPYGLDGPLAHTGGLLVHTVHLLDTVDCIVKACYDIAGHTDRSFLMLAGLLKNIGWHTTTVIVTDKAEGCDIVKRRDAFITTGIRRSGFRFMHDLLLHAESDIDIEISETRKQALSNVFAEPDEIHTLEGRILEQANGIVDTVIWAEHCINLPGNGNWSPDHNGLFVGHYN